MYKAGARNSRLRKKLKPSAAIRCGRQARSASAMIGGNSSPNNVIVLPPPLLLSRITIRQRCYYMPRACARRECSASALEALEVRSPAGSHQQIDARDRQPHRGKADGDDQRVIEAGAVQVVHVVEHP